MGNFKNNDFVLAGDIGGTKTNMGLFQMGKSRPILNAFETYSSNEATSLEEIIQRFLKKHPMSISCACFGIAGPVSEGRCKITNLPWEISQAQIKKRFKWVQVRLINDLAAAALAIPILRQKELVSLNGNRSKKRHNMALIAPGTGLGQALLVFQNDSYVPISSEGGHADFAPNNETEADLWKYLHKRFGHVSIERVLSGSGLFNIYSWLKDSKMHKEPYWLAQRFKKYDPAKVITETAMNNKEALCSESLNIFVSILGAVSGNLALFGMATGGVYLGGGIVPRILPFLKQDLFLKSFKNKGRFRDMLEKVPIKVILNDRAPILGAAIHAFRTICEK